MQKPVLIHLVHVPRQSLRLLFQLPSSIFLPSFPANYTLSTIQIVDTIFTQTTQAWPISFKVAPDVRDI